MQTSAMEVLERAAKGVIAGVAGTAVMTVAQTRLLSHIPAGESSREPRYPPESEARSENATETTARRIFEGLAHRPMPEDRKKLAGNLVHLATGTGWGLAYGLATPRRPRLVDGLVFGAIVWLVTDNLLAPSLKLSDWPWRYPPGSTLTGFLAHMFYGAASALTLRAFLR